MRCRNGTSERRRTRERRTKKCPRQPAIPARAIAPTASAPTVSAPRAKTLKRANQRALRGRYTVACYRARVLVPKTLFSLVVCNTYPLTSRDQTHVPNRKRLLSLSLARAFPREKTPTDECARTTCTFPRVVAAVVRVVSRFISLLSSLLSLLLLFALLFFFFFFFFFFVKGGFSKRATHFLALYNECREEGVVVPRTRDDDGRVDWNERPRSREWQRALRFRWFWWSW